MTTLTFDDDGYGSPQQVVVEHADRMTELRNKIRNYRWRREICSPYDCTGILFQQTAEILKVARTAAGYSAVLLVTSYFDI